MSLTIRPINTGFVTTIPKQYLYHHTTVAALRHIPDERIDMPCFAFLIEGGETPMLVDTGMAWTERANAYHHPGSCQPEGMSIIEQLAKLGYKPEDIGIIVFTHMHWDHIYYLEKFTNAKCYVHEKEYAFAMDPIPLYYKSYENPALGIERPFEHISFTLTSGEMEIVPGMRVFETFGHSPGHQCVEVDTNDGSYIICGDAIFILDNIREIPELHYNITPPGRYADIVATWKSIERIKARAKDESFLLPCHESKLVERVQKTPVLGK
ncbi:MAG: N-acyl homoserine lactonase family protein [Clostridiales bacterium]|nr:N-acyl homoserine lactonase family protein [Clostridiales bacterium]